MSSNPPDPAFKLKAKGEINYEQRNIDQTSNQDA
jgi:hypothetical protein